jgi:hypothetical protein
MPSGIDVPGSGAKVDRGARIPRHRGQVLPHARELTPLQGQLGQTCVFRQHESTQ